MQKTLRDVSGSIDDFIFEAEKCAQRKYGFAALLTVFPVMLSVSEAISGERPDVKLFERFVQEMDDQTSWIILPSSVDCSESTVGKKLADLRNGLAHQLSLPDNIALTERIADAQPLSLSTVLPACYIIGIVDFVAAVKRTVDKIIESYPEANFDSKLKKGLDRQPARTYLVRAPKVKKKG